MQRHFVDEFLIQTQYPQQARPRIRTDLIAITSLFPSLHTALTKCAVKGSTFQVTALNGTLPITYKGSQYNIPVIATLPLNYPSQAPLVYVLAAQGMVIKQTPHVQTDGKVTHPLLVNWNPKSSSLGELLNALMGSFSKNCPLFVAKNNSGSSELQKLNLELGELLKTTHSKLTQQLQEANSKKLELISHRSSLQRTLEQTQKYLPDLETKTQALKRLNSELELVLNSEQSTEVTQKLLPKDPLEKQLLEVYSEKQAIEEAWKVLLDGFATQKVPLQDFFKFSKELNSKAFLQARLKDKIILKINGQLG
mmetsp:Transcript_168/g.310  ORF Transcript_168/g.310 Transcript_168/m.310 type:complete len:309 (-) Transcript_168:8-934(-)